MDENERAVSLMESLNRRVSRKRVLAGVVGVAGVAAAGVAGATFAGARQVAHADGGSDNSSGDTPAQILTAALIAEDLATTFYYNGLVGPVIQDPNLAGHNGTATDPAKNPRKSNPGNVNYLQAALTQEIDHANLLRSLLGGSSAAGDPVQTFYFPAGSFDTLSAFLGLLDALENAFIGAYLSATEEFAAMAADVKSGAASYGSFTSKQLEYFAKVAGAIMGVESEHRVLGRVIGNQNPANNITYEQTDGINSVYNGSTSAVAALTPFLTPSTGPAYSFATAIANASSVALPSSGGIPNS